MVAELILSLSPTTVSVDTDKLHKILDKVGSLPFVLYSINGCKRTGKSYTLNHFIRYLHWSSKRKGKSKDREKVNNSKNPFEEPDPDDDDKNGTDDQGQQESIEMRSLDKDKDKEDESWFDTPLDREFQWRRGSERVTCGIHMWSEPFIVTLNEGVDGMGVGNPFLAAEKDSEENQSGGRKVAILLMDTQGLFDAETTPQQNAIIFSFSSFCSSVMIYNQMKFMDENILQNLHMFADFAGVCTPHRIKDSPQCQQLLFLIRDFDYSDEFGYGIHYRNSPTPSDDGKVRNYLHETLLLNSSTMASESKQARQKILSTFKDVSTFQMPDPGPTFRTNPSQAKPLPIFSEQLKSFLQLLASPLHMETKKVGGVEISGTEFKPFVDAWAREFKDIQSSFPTVKTIAESMAEVHNRALCKKWLSVYVKCVDGFRMDNATVKEMELVRFHEKTRDDVLDKFGKERKLGNTDMHQKFLENLKGEINLHFERVLAIHLAVRRKTKRIKKQGRRMTAGGAAVCGTGTGIITYYAVESTMGVIATCGTTIGSILGAGGVAVGVGVVATALAVQAAVKASKKPDFSPSAISTDDVKENAEGESTARKSILPRLLKLL